MKSTWLILILLFCSTPIWAQIYSEKPKGPVKELIEKSYHHQLDGKTIIPQKPIFNELYTYDEEGKEIEYIEFHNQGELWEGHKNTYDKKGQKTGKYTWSGGDSTFIAWTDSISYDHVNNRIFLQHYHKNYGFEFTTILQLNKKKQVISEKWQKPDSTIIRNITYTYNKQGKKLKEIFTGGLTYYYIYKYNTRGELIYDEYSSYYFEYVEHDKFGNWTRRIQRSTPKDNFVLITDRIITYY
jgi:hypothetical protein